MNHSIILSGNQLNIEITAWTLCLTWLFSWLLIIGTIIVTRPLITWEALDFQSSYQLHLNVFINLNKYWENTHSSKQFEIAYLLNFKPDLRISFFIQSRFFLPRVFLFHSKSELLWKRIFLLNARCFFWNLLVIGYSKYPIKLPKNDLVEMFQSISRVQKSCLLMDDLELIDSWQMTMLMFSILNVNDERLITWSKVCSAIIIHSNTSYNSCYQIELLKVFTKLNIFGLVLADCITVTSKHGNFQYKASSNDMTLGATCGLYFITDPDKRIEIEITHLELSCEGGIISVSLSLISYQKKKN